MNEALNILAAGLGAVWAFFGWKGLGIAVASLWLGDFMGRRYPQAWGWLRAGLKRAGDKASERVRDLG